MYVAWKGMGFFFTANSNIFLFWEEIRDAICTVNWSLHLFSIAPAYEIGIGCINSAGNSLQASFVILHGYIKLLFQGNEVRERERERELFSLLFVIHSTF